MPNIETHSDKAHLGKVPVRKFSSLLDTNDLGRALGSTHRDDVVINGVVYVIDIVIPELYG